MFIVSLINICIDMIKSDFVCEASRDRVVNVRLQNKEFLAVLFFNLYGMLSALLIEER